MLLAALGATVIGFVLLIVALITANLWLAIACVVVSVIGVGLLLADVLTYRRGDRDSSLDRDAGRDEDSAPWTPGAEDDRVRDTLARPTPPLAAGAGPIAHAGPVDEAEREASTVGNESFGHHDTVADDERPTSHIPKVADGGDWSHESQADTDGSDIGSPASEFRGLLAPGTYDPDMTDQIPQVENDQTWGSRWSPPEGTGKK